jgi:type III secretion protein V
VTPIVVEIGDALVPIVDSRQDGGVFLYQLIPAMRERIQTTSGVLVPGVRMRGDTELPREGFRVQVDEVHALVASAPLGATFTVQPGEGRRAGGELTDVHPLTGEPGRWSIVRVAEGHPPGSSLITTAQYLIHKIELVIRAHLARYLGPQEVATLVETWAEDGGDADLVATVLPDDDARLRLTWVLQGLVDENVPIDDWRTVLAAIQAAGGMTMPTSALRRAARGSLRARLPGPRTGKPAVSVPTDHEQALRDQTPGEPLGYPHRDAQHDFLRWLRQTIAVSGPAITLVTATQDGRELVGALARTEERLVATLSEDEVGSR